MANRLVHFVRDSAEPKSHVSKSVMYTSDARSILWSSIKYEVGFDYEYQSIGYLLQYFFGVTGLSHEKAMPMDLYKKCIKSVGNKDDGTFVEFHGEIPREIDVPGSAPALLEAIRHKQLEFPTAHLEEYLTTRGMNPENFQLNMDGINYRLYQVGINIGGYRPASSYYGTEVFHRNATLEFKYAHPKDLSRHIVVDVRFSQNIRRRDVQSDILILDAMIAKIRMPAIMQEIKGIDKVNISNYMHHGYTVAIESLDAYTEIIALRDMHSQLHNLNSSLKIEMDRRAAAEVRANELEARILALEAATTTDLQNTNVLSLNMAKQELLAANSQISINRNPTRFIWENSLTSNIAFTFSAVVLLVILFKIAKLCRGAVREPIRFNRESHNTENQSLDVPVTRSDRPSDKRWHKSSAGS